MPARTEKLRETLRDLHAELETQGSVDPELRALLESAVGDIQSALDGLSARTGARESTDSPSVGDQLAETARHFEASHPTLAAALGRVIDALAALGI